MNSRVTSTRWVLAMYVLLRDLRGRMLLLRRSPRTKHFSGTWELPGGKPAPGEAFDRTALLEAIEETGLDVELDGVAGATEASVPGLRVAALVMEGRALSSEVKLSPEHDGFRWLTLAEVGTLKLRPGFETFFACYGAGTGRSAGKQRPARSTAARSKRSAAKRQ